MTQEIFDRVVRDGRRRRARFLGGAAVVLAGLVTAGVVLLPGATGTDRLVAVDGSPPAASPSDCPATAELAPPEAPAAVPEQPRGFDRATRLLPGEVPSSVVVCRYDVVSTTSGDDKPSVAALRSGRSLSGGLEGFAEAFDVAVPGSFEFCRFVGPLVAEPVRVSVRYPSGARAWLATETDVNGCAPIGNGESTSQTYLAPELIEAWEAGRWGPAAEVASVSEPDCPTEAAALSFSTAAADRYPVPEPPKGFDAAARLVPDETPAAVLICRYSQIPFDARTAGTLVGGRPIAGDLVDLTRVLMVPLLGDFGACTLAGNAPEPLRVLLRYPSGASTWLATETDRNACTGIGNGVASSESTYLAEDLMDAWDRGRWERLQPRYPCDVPDGGRPGQTETLVPEGSETVSICRGGTFEPLADPAAIVRLLSAASTEAPAGSYDGDRNDGRYGGNGCSGDGTSDEATRRDVLRIGYPTGRSVAVSVTVGCTPSWQNGTLGAQPTPEQQQQLLDR